MRGHRWKPPMPSPVTANWPRPKSEDEWEDMVLRGLPLTSGPGYGWSMTGDQRKPDAPSSGGVDAEPEASSKQSPEKPAPSPGAAAAKPAGAVLPAGTS